MVWSTERHLDLFRWRASCDCQPCVSVTTWSVTSQCDCKFVTAHASKYILFRCAQTPPRRCVQQSPQSLEASTKKVHVHTIIHLQSLKKWLRLIILRCVDAHFYYSVFRQRRREVPGDTELLAWALRDDIIAAVIKHRAFFRLDLQVKSSKASD